MTELILKGFMGYGAEQTMRFSDEPGLWLIEGLNGAGKSSLAEGITVALFNATIRNLPYVNEQVFLGCDTSEVTFKMDGHEFTRQRKLSEKTSTLKSFYNGQQLDSDEVTRTAKSKLGLNFDAFTCSVVFPQDSLGFADKKNMDRMEIFGLLLDLIKWDVYREVARTTRDVISVQISELKGKRSSYETLLQIDTADLERQSKEFEAKRKEKVTNLEADLIVANGKVEHLKQVKETLETTYTEAMSTIDKKVADIYSEMTAVNSEIGKSKKIRDSNDAVNRKISNIMQEIARSTTKIAQLDKDIMLLSQSICALCKQPLRTEQQTLIIGEKQADKGNIVAGMGLQEKEVETLKAKIEAVPDISPLVKKYDSLSEHRTLELRKKSELEQKKNSIDSDLTHATRNANSIIIILGSAKEEANPHAVRLKEKKDLVEDAKGKIEDLDKKLKSQEASLSIANRLMQVFRSIKTYIVDGALDEFETRANYYVCKMVDGPISIRFSTMKGSGAKMKDAFNIELTDARGSRSYEAWSGGEKRRISLAIDMGLSDMLLNHSACPLSFCIYDEVFDGLDRLGKPKAFNLLQELSSNRAVYVISHDDEMRKFFTNRIIIEAEPQGSRIVQ